MAYEPKYTKPYEGGYQDLPSKETPVTAEILNSLEDSVTSVEEQLKKTTEIYDTNKINLGRASTDTNTVPYNVALGYNNTASGYASFAEGIGNTVTGQYGHVEGAGNTVAAIGAHAEGQSNTVDGSYSHVEGTGNKASSSYQHVQGKFNEEDTNGRFAHIVGGGTSDTARKNIHTVDWNGNAYFAGDVTDGAGNYLSRKAQGISMEIDAEALTIQLLTSAGIVCGTAELTADELKEALEIYALMDDVEELNNAKDITTTTSPTMQNSYPGRVLINEIGGGETQQGSTTGAQLFDASRIVTTSIGGAIITNNGDGSFTISGSGALTATEATRYELTVEETKALLKEGSLHLQTESSYPVVGVQFHNHDTDVVEGMLMHNSPNSTTGNTVDITDYVNGNYSVAFLFYGKEGHEVVPGTIRPMFYQDGDGTWEPYTGGIPSPNPEYPQEIEATVVSEIKTVGENLLKPYLKASVTSGGITYVPNSDGTFTITGTRTSVDPILAFDNKVLPGTYTLFSTNNTGSAIFCYIRLDDELIVNSASLPKRLVLNVTEECNLKIHIKGYLNGYVYNGILSVMLVSGDVTEIPKYEPYTETVQKLSNPITLYRIGDAQDKIVQKYGFCNVGRNMHSITINALSSFDSTYLYGRRSIPKGIVIQTDWNYAYKNAISNLFNTFYSANQLRENTDLEGISIMYTKDAVDYILFRINSIEQTEEAYNAFLAETQLEVVFEMAETLYEPLPIADQIALNSLPTYSTVTHIFTDAEIEPTYELKYGTSEVGGYTLEGLLAGRNGELTAQNNAERLTALEAAVVSNI